MPEYLAPGVYVEEVSFRAKSIEGVSTSTTAFVGPTLKGPLSHDPDDETVKDLVTPEVITSLGEFQRMFGGLSNLSFSPATDGEPDKINHLALGAKAFFDNGGGRLFVARAFAPRGPNDPGVAATTPFVGQGGAATDQARFTARQPGAWLNGKVRVKQHLSTAKQKTLDTALPGTLLCTGTQSPAKAAELEGGPPPFRLADGDGIHLDVSGNAVDLVFNGTPAEAPGTPVLNPGAVNIPAAGVVLQVTITGWQGTQQISVPPGPAGQPAPTLDALALTINQGLRGGHARVDNGNTLVIVSDLGGTAVQVTADGAPELGFAIAVQQNGGGNVARLDAVTVAEIAALVQPAMGITVGQSGRTGNLVITTTQVGTAATLQSKNTTAAALGLPAAQAKGADGNVPVYLIKQDGQWKNDQGNVDNNPLQNGASLVTWSATMEYPDKSEVNFEDLGFSPQHRRWAGEILAENPKRRADALANPIFLNLGNTLADDPAMPFKLQQGLFGNRLDQEFPMTGGNDGAEPEVASYETGLNLLHLADDVSIVAAPGYTSYPEAKAEGIQNSLIAHAENNRYRIAVLDTPARSTIGEAQDWRSRIDSTRAALYYPWVVVPNPNARPGDDRIPKEIALPPSGFVAGIYARTDVTRGVWKPPANEVVFGALRFERDVTFGQQQILNPRGVNCLRFFYGRGYRVWGARTASSDPEWKYVNVRRYFIYLEKSIDRSMQWAVFEPNGEALWANVRTAVLDFLYNEWRNGALLGSKPEEAYFVRCDRSTMTQNDLDNGRLVCLIGVAALKPAEFVIFRIGQKTADARS